MSEEQWYRDIAAGDRPPRCKRVIRLDTATQMQLTIEFAMAIADNRAHYRTVFMRTGGSGTEYYVHWPHPLTDSGWWLIPARMSRAARAIIHEATQCELRRASMHGLEWVHRERIVARLLIWQRSGKFRRKAVWRTERDCIHRGFGGWYLKMFSPPGKVRRRKKHDSPPSVAHWWARAQAATP